MLIQFLSSYFLISFLLLLLLLPFLSSPSSLSVRSCSSSSFFFPSFFSFSFFMPPFLPITYQSSFRALLVKSPDLDISSAEGGGVVFFFFSTFFKFVCPGWGLESTAEQGKAVLCFTYCRRVCQLLLTGVLVFLFMCVCVCVTRYEGLGDSGGWFWNKRDEWR